MENQNPPDVTTVAAAINCLSSFLADEQISGPEGLNDFLQSLPAFDAEPNGPSTPTDVVVFCASAVLSVAEDVFSAFSKAPATDLSRGLKKVSLRGRNLVLVLCGGIGHSTSFLHDAVRRHPRYRTLGDKVDGQPEARILQMIAEQWYGLTVSDTAPSDAVYPIQSQDTLLVTVEDRSTNCGANASESRKVLDSYGVRRPRSITVVQDPTMCRRTVASFAKTYADLGDDIPKLTSWPTFVPEVAVKDAGPGKTDSDALHFLDFATSGPTGLRRECLWEMRRFVDLLMGEIPRLRDDPAGYGPKGKGFITHVDVPADVEEAWKTVSSVLGAGGRGQ